MKQRTYWHFEFFKSIENEKVSQRTKIASPEIPLFSGPSYCLPIFPIPHKYWDFYWRIVSWAASVVRAGELKVLPPDLRAEVTIDYLIVLSALLINRYSAT